jgi:hypothetical protein
MWTSGLVHEELSTFFLPADNQLTIRKNKIMNTKLITARAVLYQEVVAERDRAGEVNNSTKKR